jgi:vancomycin permeability regulator SanA
MNLGKNGRLLLRVILVVAAFWAMAATALLWDGLHDNIARADMGLVLGNTVFPDGTPSPRLAARLDRAIELYEEDRFEKILASGALGKEGHDEAVVMRDYLMSRGVPSERILIDSHGYTTYDSARNTMNIMREHNFRSVLVVSQYFHLPRARLAMRRFGVAPVYTAHAHFFEWRDLYSIPREVLGFLKYACRSYDE